MKCSIVNICFICGFKKLYMMWHIGNSALKLLIEIGLTGATTILRSDLLYDRGQSLNPAVDLGQVSSKEEDNTRADLRINENVLL
jgi:hypothetical protein